MPTTVAIADDHPIVLSGLASLIRADRAFEVIGSAASGPAILQIVRERRPEIVVLDLRMPGLSGIEVMHSLRAEALTTKVILLTAAISDIDIFAAVDGGVAGLTLKEAAPESLLDCLHEVVAGRRWLPSELVDGPLARELERRARWQDLSRALTTREVEVVRLIVAGHLNKEIAFELGLSEGTVKVHLNNVFRKLKVGSRQDLLALTAGLL